ncbi:hypothetical protein GQ53DRAFT_14355 [Thozetella sp. PMI_491]|nr:hypothetical protein GQ53DRAFT_14355 [Thozetella sp. PMI_491]
MQPWFAQNSSRTTLSMRNSYHPPRIHPSRLRHHQEQPSRVQATPQSIKSFSPRNLKPAATTATSQGLGTIAPSRCRRSKSRNREWVWWLRKGLGRFRPLTLRRQRKVEISRKQHGIPIYLYMRVPSYRGDAKGGPGRVPMCRAYYICTCLNVSVR